MELTREAAVKLAEFIHAAVRPDWDVAGIVAALGEVRDREAADVAVAAITAAGTSENRTPKVIALNGPHWSHPAVRQRPEGKHLDGQGTCAICYNPEWKCKAQWAHDHMFESITASKERAIRAADRPPSLRRRPVPYYNHRHVEDVELP